MMGMEGAGGGQEGSRPETFDGCKHDSLGGTKVKTVEWFVGE